MIGGFNLKIKYKWLCHLSINKICWVGRGIGAVGIDYGKVGARNRI